MAEVMECAQIIKELEPELQTLYMEANSTLMEIDEMLKNNLGGGNGSRRLEFRTDKLVILAAFDNAVPIWRKWKEEVPEYLDDEEKDRKDVMDEVSRSDTLASDELLAMPRF